MELSLRDGSSIYTNRADGTLQFFDHTGYDFRADDVDLRSLLAGRGGIGRRDTAGYVALQGEAEVIVSWVTTDDGSAIVYVHTRDRAYALAPIYITRRERDQLAAQAT